MATIPSAPRAVQVAVSGGPDDWKNIHAYLQKVRKMLQNDITDENLATYRDQLKQYIPEEALPYFINQNEETTIEFPVEAYPVKPKSLNLSKTPEYIGVLKGIKGQYLIFEDQTVFNIRANEGLVVNINSMTS